MSLADSYTEFQPVEDWMLSVIKLLVSREEMIRFVQNPNVLVPMFDALSAANGTKWIGI